MTKNTFSCVFYCFGAIFVLVLARGIYGLVVGSPLMSEGMCVLNQSVDEGVALLTLSWSTHGSHYGVDTLTLSPLTC